MSSKVTIDAVARHAQVSRQTVSNAINSPHLLREETLQRVRAAIDALGYRVSQAARQMRTGRSGLIAVRIEPARDGINGNILDRFLHELTEAAALIGYRLMLYTATDDDSEIATYDDLLARYDLDGFVLTGTHHGDARTGWLAGRGVPFVTFGRPWGAPDDHCWIDVDGAAGTNEATRWLLTNGHRRIAFVGSPEEIGVGDDRRQGWATAMQDAGLEISGLERHVPDTVGDGVRAAADLLSGTAAPTALVCASDSLALGALRASAGRAARVAVIGFDDTPVAQAVGLTTVSQPLAEVAGACVEMLARLLRTGSGSQHLLLQPRLVIRDSA